MDKTKKALIGIMPDIQSYIVQPNRITNAIYSYTLFQERIFTAIMFYLQESVAQSMQGNDKHQLALFPDSEFIIVQLALKEISEPYQYPDVKQALTEMAGIVMNIPFVNEKGKNWVSITNLLNAKLPESGDFGGVVKIEIRKSVAKLLIEIDRNPHEQPINYTRFIYQIAMQGKNKYTSRLYKVISSWKKKGDFTITLENLKEQLGVDGKYMVYKDFKKRVLLPAFTELYKRSDCWFNLNDDDFEIREGQAVTHLHFRVITMEFSNMDDERADYVRHLLRTHFDFGKEDIDQIGYILSDPAILIGEITHKVMHLADYVQENKIINKKAYALKSLLNAYPKK